MEELKQERAQLQRKIEMQEEVIRKATQTIHWTKKHIRLLDRQIADYQETSADTLQDISDNLK